MEMTFEEWSAQKNKSKDIKLLRALESKESYLLTVVDELDWAIETCQQRMPDTYSKLNAENVTRTIHCGAAMHILATGYGRAAKMSALNTQREANKCFAGLLCIAPVNGGTEMLDGYGGYRVPKPKSSGSKGFRLWSPRRGDRVGVNPEAAAAAKEAEKAEKAAKTDVIRQHEDNLGSRRKLRFSRRRSSAAAESTEGESFRSDTSYSDPAPPPPPPPRPASAQPPAPRRASRWRPGTGGGSQKFLSSKPAAERTWSYVDSYSRMQGPFAESQIKQWIARGDLPANLQMIPGNGSGGQEFRPLSHWLSVRSLVSATKTANEQDEIGQLAVSDFSTAGRNSSSLGRRDSRTLELRK